MNMKKKSKSAKNAKTSHWKFKNSKENKRERLTQEIENLKQAYGNIKSSQIEKFTDFPLSAKTKKGLKETSYEVPTAIQKQSIGLALQGYDILGAAKTGSGKTLAFLLPVLEKLYLERWSPIDGLGALIISPTRELAYQIFEVLRTVGKYHDFSAALVIGGKHLREESQKINSTNIIICTPGRLLQHMDETFKFNADNLQILVLDEADRILDMGFKETMNAIIENLPPKRQTLLFSATQTKSVKSLARLSLKDPLYVSVHEHSEHSTPTQLRQSYIVCELHEKMDMLWSFIKHHLRAKTLVFMTSCKQTRFIYEAFKHLRPGVPVLCLHGAMQQLKRVSVYNSFKNQRHAVLFATDIAARGLDFPSVHWVVQFDCPEDVNTYIHRAGRTARYEKNGESLLVLTPSEEESMVAQLRTKKIPIEKIEVNKMQLKTVEGKLQAYLAARVDIKEFAQRAFVSYLKAISYMKDKSVFDISKLDTDSYARSLGLAVIPRVRLLEKTAKQRQKASGKAEDIQISKLAFKTSSDDSDQLESSDESETGSDDDSDESETEPVKKKNSNKLAVKSKRTLQNESSEENGSLESDSDMDNTKLGSKQSNNLGEKVGFDVGGSSDDDDDEGLFKVKKKVPPQELVTTKEDAEESKQTESKVSKKGVLTKAAVAKKLLKKKIKVNSKMVFDEDGEVIEDKLKKVLPVADEEQDDGGIDITTAKKRMQEADKVDKELHRERIRKRHQEKKQKEREARKRKSRDKDVDEDETEGVVAYLAVGSSDVEAASDYDNNDVSDSDAASDDISGNEGGGFAELASGGSDGEGDYFGESNSDDSESSASEDERPPSKKVRTSLDSVSKKPSKRDDAQSKDSCGVMTKESGQVRARHSAYEVGQSLQDDEMMALHLLSK